MVEFVYFFVNPIKKSHEPLLPDSDLYIAISDVIYPPIRIGAAWLIMLRPYSRTEKKSMPSSWTLQAE